MQDGLSKIRFFIPVWTLIRKDRPSRRPGRFSSIFGFCVNVCALLNQPLNQVPILFFGNIMQDRPFIHVFRIDVRPMFDQPSNQFPFFNIGSKMQEGPILIIFCINEFILFQKFLNQFQVVIFGSIKKSFCIACSEPESKSGQKIPELVQYGLVVCHGEISCKKELVKPETGKNTPPTGFLAASSLCPSGCRLQSPQNKCS